jgi:hypothetical protein
MLVTLEAVPGYTIEEKISIANKYLVKAAQKACVAFVWLPLNKLGNQVVGVHDQVGRCTGHCCQVLQRSRGSKSSKND